MVPKNIAESLMSCSSSRQAVTDICLAGATCWYLRRDRWRGMRNRTAIQLNTLIRWSLQSGIFTSAIVLGTALCFVFLTDSRMSFTLSTVINIGPRYQSCGLGYGGPSPQQFITGPAQRTRISRQHRPRSPTKLQKSPCFRQPHF